MVSDPIGDMLIRVKNAGMVGKPEVSIPYSKIKHAIADVLVKAGYIVSVEKNGKKTDKCLDITLKYEGKKHAIRGVKRVSKPSRRLYMGAKEIKPVLHGAGTLVLSTPKGVLSANDAKKENVGGEALFIIY